MAKNEVTLGIDIGGPNTIFGFVDRAGHCLANSSMLTNAHQSAEIYFERLQENIKLLQTKLPRKYELKGIGVGAPNANYLKGTIEHPPNLNWAFVDVVAELGKFFDLPISVTNDANAAALGEMLFGAAQGMKNFIVITLGTGLGSGIVANGELIIGSDGFAGEVGHTIVDPKGRECGCGRRGCLEAYASATGIRRTVYELMCTRMTPSELRNTSYEQLTSQMIYEAALRGDRMAMDAFEITGQILGMKLADSVAHFSPEAIILFGGLAAAGDLIFKPTKRALEENLFGVFKNKVALLPSAIAENKAAIFGASALIWNDLEKKSKSSWMRLLSNRIGEQRQKVPALPISKINYTNLDIPTYSGQSSLQIKSHETDS
jgi:glucokinase